MRIRHYLLTAPVLALTGALIGAQAAQALSITNRDTSDVTVTVSEGESKPAMNLTVKPGETLDNICATGCEISLANGVTDSFEGEETVLIEGGQLTISE